MPFFSERAHRHRTITRTTVKTRGGFRYKGTRGAYHTDDEARCGECTRAWPALRRILADALSISHVLVGRALSSFRRLEEEGPLYRGVYHSGRTTLRRRWYLL